MDDRRSEHDGDKLAQRQEHGNPMLADGERHEAEHPDGRVHHDDVGHPDHGFAHQLEHAQKRPAGFTERAEGKAEHHGKKDDLEHVALGQRVHGIHGHNVQKGLNEVRRGHRSRLEALGGEVKPYARLRDVGKHKPDDHRDSRCGEVVHKRFDRYASEFAQIMNAGCAGNDGRQHQRHHNHADQRDEQLPQGAEVCSAHIGGNHQPDKHPHHQPDNHLSGQTQFRPRVRHGTAPCSSPQNAALPPPYWHGTTCCLVCATLLRRKVRFRLTAGGIAAVSGLRPSEEDMYEMVSCIV